MSSSSSSSPKTSPVLVVPTLNVPTQPKRRRSFVQTLQLNTVTPAKNFIKAPTSPISLSFIKAPLSPTLGPASPIKAKFDQALTVGKSLFTRSKSTGNISAVALEHYFDEVDGCFIVSMKGRESVGVYSTVRTDSGPKLSIYTPQDSLQNTARKLKLVNPGKHSMLHLRISMSAQPHKDASTCRTQVECLNPWLLRDERKHMCTPLPESHPWGDGNSGFAAYLEYPCSVARTILTCPGVAFGVLLSRTGAEWRKDAGHKHAVYECLSLPLQHRTPNEAFVLFETGGFGKMSWRENKGDTVDVWVHPNALRLYIG